MVIFQFFLRPRFGSEEVHRNFKGSDSSGKVSHKAVWNKGKANLGKVWRLFYFTGIKNPVGPKILRKLERTSGSVRESELYLLPLPMDSPGTPTTPWMATESQNYMYAGQVQCYAKLLMDYCIDESILMIHLDSCRIHQCRQTAQLARPPWQIIFLSPAGCRLWHRFSQEFWSRIEQAKTFGWLAEKPLAEILSLAYEFVVRKQQPTRFLSVEEDSCGSQGPTSMIATWSTKDIFLWSFFWVTFAAKLLTLIGSWKLEARIWHLK